LGKALKNDLVKTLIIDVENIFLPHSMPLLSFYLSSQLVSTGRSVTILSKSTVPEYELFDQVEYIAGDFSQLSLIRSLLKTHQEVIYIAYTVVPSSTENDSLQELMQNLTPAIQLFSEAAKTGAKLVLISTGGMVYGEALELPINEHHLTKPISSYGMIKLTLENYAYLYAGTYGLKYICVRPSNIYGEGQRPFSGQGFIATAMMSAIKGQPIQIFGQQGTIRDYIYVSDLASGIVNALEYGQLSETYNIGSGIGLSNLEVFNVIEVLMHEINCNVKVSFLPERGDDLKVNILDSTKLQAHSGWAPKVEFYDGMRRTRAWLSKIENE
jgi:UDP-glucose 4-epimerase